MSKIQAKPKNRKISIDTDMIKAKLATAKLSVADTVDKIKYDVQAVKDRDPAARSSAEVLLLYSGVHALMAYRVAHKLYENKHYFAARAISQGASKGRRAALQNTVRGSLSARRRSSETTAHSIRE